MQFSLIFITRNGANLQKKMFRLFLIQNKFFTTFISNTLYLIDRKTLDTLVVAVAT